MPFETNNILRFFRVLISVFVCLLASAMIASAIWSDIDGHITYRAAAPLFAMVFLAPGTAIVLGIFTVGLFVLDRYQARRRDRAPWGEKTGTSLVWPAVCLAGSFAGFLHPLVGAVFIFLLLYWCLTGRLQGGPGWSIRNFGTARRDEQISLVFVGVLALVWIKSAGLWLILALPPANFGTPPYVPRYDREMTAGLKVAMRRFPDPQSCLVKGADATIREDLLRMDWDRIDTSNEAKVCMFRLLHEWGGADEAGEWLEAQGFKIPAGASSERPFVTYDGNKRVDGAWRSKEYGPRYPTTGIIRRVFNGMAYFFSVHATYSPDGKRLLFVSTSSAVT